MRAALALLAVALAHAPSGVAAQEARSTEPDLGGARTQALATRARLKREAATWRVVLESRAGARIAVDVLSTPVAQRRIVYMLGKDGVPREALRVVIHKDGWYVSEAGGARGIYRPRQAPFAFSRAYAVLDAVALRFVGERSPGRFLSRKDGLATYRARLPKAQRARLVERVQKLERIARLSPKKSSALEPRLREAREALARGRQRTVHLATGILFGHGRPGSRVRVTRFTWRKSFALTAFAIEDGKGALPDRRPLVAGAPALLAHSGHWRKGAVADELDARLITIPGGATRRVPYRGAVSLPGCLLPGQNAVVVCGQDSGGVGLYRVDLATGKNTRLGGAALRAGVCFSPALAPDKKLLAVLHMPEPRRPRAQVYLLDLVGGEATPLGKTLPTRGLSWFPDGSALLLDRRVQFLPGKPATTSLARLDRGRGTIRILREGDSPRIALGGKAILFRDKADWSLCELDGTKPRRLGDGLATLSQPAVSPDGKRALMLRAAEAGPQPVVVDLTTGKLTPLQIEAALRRGLWGFPAW